MKPTSNIAIGEQFGKLTIIGAPISKNGLRWPCSCKCGNARVVVNITRLRERKVSGGGCERCYRVKHGRGHSSNPTYAKWQAMKARCLNPRNGAYVNYGGRGVTVCAEWVDDFKAFLKDMGDPPAGTSLDRIDPNGNYEPGNCRWATAREQAANKRNSQVVRVGDLTYPCLAAAARAFGLPYSTVRARTTRYGWPIERALATPIDSHKAPHYLKEVHDEEMVS